MSAWGRPRLPNACRAIFRFHSHQPRGEGPGYLGALNARLHINVTSITYQSTGLPAYLDEDYSPLVR